MKITKYLHIVKKKYLSNNTKGKPKHNSVKRSDVTGNRFEWELGENKVI